MRLVQACRKNFVLLVCVCVCVCCVYMLVYFYSILSKSIFYNTVKAFSTMLNKIRSNGSSVVSCGWKEGRTDIFS